MSDREVESVAVDEAAVGEELRGDGG